MKNNEFNYEELPAIVSIGELTYNLNEIEHQFYMFDHRMVGCITLLCTRPVEKGKGVITIDGAEVKRWFLTKMNFGDYGRILTLSLIHI